MKLERARSRERVTTRRTFLTALGGTLALPLFEARVSRGQDVTAPRRIVLFYTANGTNPADWFPATTSDPRSFTLAPIHAPLAAHQSRLVLVDGVNSTVAQDPANNGGPHQRGIGSLFTGELLQEGEFKDGCGSLAGWANGPSIDQVVAQLVGYETPFSSLELGVRSFESDVQGRISYAAAGQPLPPINDPTELYRRLFFRGAPVDAGDPMSRDASIVSAAKSQFALLQRKVSAADRDKLDQHLSLVTDLERRLGLAGTIDTSSCPSIQQPEPLEPDSEETMPRVSREHLDLLAVALACDLTRAASVQYSTGFNRIRYPWVDSSREGHALSHAGNSDTAAWAELTRRQVWHAGELAYFMDRLASIPEGEGTLLDSTLIVWGSDVSQGNSHSLDRMPYLLAGGAQGALRMGQALTYSGASSNDLLLTLLRSFGYEGATFGHPGHSVGELPGLLA